MSNTTIKTPQAPDQLIQDYYSNLVTVTLDDYKDEMAKALENSLFRFETCLEAKPSTNPLPTFNTEVERINNEISFFVQRNQLSRYKTFALTGQTDQSLVAAIAAALKEGYEVVTDSKMTHGFNFKRPVKQFILKKPAKQIAKEEKQIREGIKALFEERVELENEAMLSTATALTWATTEHNKQQQEYQNALKKKALKAAEAAKKTKEGK